MALRNRSIFQRALLNRQAQNVASGRAVTDTSDISAAVAGQDARMKSAFGNIALSKKARSESNRQFSKRLRLEKQDLKSAKEELPWRIGLGLAGTALAGYQGMENRKEMARQTNEQKNQTSMMKSILEETILKRELQEGEYRYGFLPGGE